MSGAVSIRTSKRIPLSGPTRAEGVRTGSDALPRIEEKSVRGLKPVRSTEMTPESVLRWLVPRRFSSALAARSRRLGSLAMKELGFDLALFLKRRSVENDNMRGAGNGCVNCLSIRSHRRFMRLIDRREFVKDIAIRRIQLVDAVISMPQRNERVGLCKHNVRCQQNETR